MTFSRDEFNERWAIKMDSGIPEEEAKRQAMAEQKARYERERDDRAK